MLARSKPSSGSKSFFAKSTIAATFEEIAASSLTATGGSFTGTTEIETVAKFDAFPATSLTR